MSKSNTFENDWLLLVFNGTAIANIADNAATAPLTDLFVALHTADPGEAGTQDANEADYTGYGRATVARTSGGWTVAGNNASNTALVSWPEKTGGADDTVTHWSVGVAVSGATKILYYGTLTTSRTIRDGDTPQAAIGELDINED